MKTFWEELQGYRTILLNALLMLPLVLELAEVRALIPVEYIEEYALLVAVLNVIMRTQTTTPLGKK